MMKAFFTATLPALALLGATPLAAQDEVDMTEMSAEERAAMAEAMGGIFGDAFKADPLTPEQEARLPAATSVIEKIFPAGTFGKMMDESMKPMLEGMMGGALGDSDTLQTLARLSGRDQFDLMGMDDGAKAEAIALIDPYAKQRQEAMLEATFSLTTKLMNRIEPSYRAGLERAYAKRFSVEELTEIDRFFSTPVGGKYAGESMIIAMDPQVMSAMNEMMPAMMELLPEMMEQFTALAAVIPGPRQFGELSGTEQSRLAELLEVPLGELKTNSKEMEAVEEAEEIVMAAPEDDS